MKTILASQDILSRRPSGYLKWTKHPPIHLTMNLLCLSVPSLGFILTLFPILLLDPLKSHFHSKINLFFFPQKADYLTSPCSGSPIVLAFLGHLQHTFYRYPVPDVMSADIEWPKSHSGLRSLCVLCRHHRNRLLAFSIHTLGPMDGEYAERNAWTWTCRCAEVP